MKSIKAFDESLKYFSPDFEKVEKGIYKRKDRFVTCLSFQQEPELGEGMNAADISQYPLEDILDRFSVYVSDFYKEINSADSKTCILEFSGFTLQDIQKLRGIIGKHVYNQKKHENGQDYAELIIE